MPTLLSQVITTIKDSSYLSNVATIELMARVKKIMSTANMYNGTGTINVSDVFVLFGLAAAIYFAINFSLSCIVRTMQKKRAAAPVRQTGYTVEAKKIFARGELELKDRIGNRVGAGIGTAVGIAESK